MSAWYDVMVYFLGFMCGVVFSSMFIVDHFEKKYWDRLIKSRAQDTVRMMQWATEDRHICGDCGEILQSVRPGKYQCPNPFCPPKMQEVQEFNDGE